MPSLVEIERVVLEKKILKFRQYIFVFRDYLPSLEKARAIHLHKLEPTSPKDALCPVVLVK